MVLTTVQAFLLGLVLGSILVVSVDNLFKAIRATAKGEKEIRQRQATEKKEEKNCKECADVYLDAMDELIKLDVELKEMREEMDEFHKRWDEN